MNCHQLLKMTNSIQTYEWGSRDGLSHLFGIPNEYHQPQAELWMGAHPKSPSQVIVDGVHYSLNDVIGRCGDKLLGAGVTERFGKRLPYLLKVLSAATPLSIQVHPNKAQAEQGFRRENDAGISLSAFHRNYQDDNHKPELVYALTPFKALNGFRPISDVLTLFRCIESSLLFHLVDALANNQSEAGLKAFFIQLMQLNEEQYHDIIKAALTAVRYTDPAVFKVLQILDHQYPGDRGGLSPLLLNVVDLQPGEAMFLRSGTLHTYLEGTGLEVMACSDNVIRGGLTPKHVDVAELLSIIQFSPLPAEHIKLLPERQGRITDFPVPVDDFSFAVIEVGNRAQVFHPACVTLLFCQCGEIHAECDKNMLALKAGESCLVPALLTYKLHGKGCVIVVSCCV